MKAFWFGGSPDNFRHDSKHLLVALEGRKCASTIECETKPAGPRGTRLCPAGAMALHAIALGTCRCHFLLGMSSSGKSFLF